MTTLSKLENCRVIIRETEYNTMLADTKILDYDSELLTIQIANYYFDATSYKELSLLILSGHEVFEFLGKVKRVFSDHIEIGLYKGKHKENRRAPRYDIHTDGKVEDMIVLGQKVHLKEKIKVHIDNISRKGVMIKALSNTFYPDIPFELKVPNVDYELVLTCCVVWSKNIDYKISYYGCKFIEATRKEVSGDESY